MTNTTAATDPAEEAARLRAAVAALDAQRPQLGDAVVDAAVDAMNARLAALDAHPHQQRKQATVLFADVVGFTTLSETRDPEIVTQIMNNLWELVDAAILGQDGRIDKHIGDAVLAVWGAGAAREDDAERAIRAALAMQAATDQCCHLFGIPLMLRIGIHTGLVLAGQVGTAGEVTVMGDTVNLASRVEGAAPPGGILITHATYRHVRGVFDVRPREPLTVRGVADKVAVYLVRGAKPRAFRLGTRGVEGVETRMVGRDAELRALQDAFEATLADDHPRALLVVGDAGVGKSRLLYEFENWIELRPEEVVYFKGRATPYTRDVPFGLFRDLFANRFDILDSDPPAVALDKFRAGFAPQGTDPARDAADIVGHWLGFDFDASPAVARLLGSPEFGLTAQAHLFRHFRALAAGDPLILFLEDMHWSDEPSLRLAADLLSYLREAAAEAPLPILGIGVARPALFERRPEWADAAGFARIPVRPLSGQHTRELIDDILQRVEHLPDRLRERIAIASEGNPFFVEELVKMLIEQGVVERPAAGQGEADATGGSLLDEPWRVATERFDALRVPPTLMGLIQARLDGLPAAERRALQLASVIGRTFWDEAVDWLNEGGEPSANALAALDAARERELIFRRDRSAFAGTGEYIFKHALLCDVAYETVLLRDRRRLHSRVARWLEAHAGERLDEYLGVVAAHCMAAEEKERAAAYLARSGEVALAAGNHLAARDAFQRAANLASPSPALLARLGEAAVMLSDHTAGEVALTRALAGARDEADRATEVDSIYWLSRVAAARGDFAAATVWLEGVLPTARDLGGQYLARTLEGLAGSAGSRGDLDAAERMAAEGLALARDCTDRVMEMRCLMLLGMFARLRGDLDAADGHFSVGRALARRAGNLEREATALINLGDLAYRREQFADARDYAATALDLFHDQGQPDAVAVAAGNLAQADLRLGAVDDAGRNARRALAAAHAASAPPLALFALSVYAQVAAANGDAPHARALLRLVRDHPATEFQDRQEAETLLDGLGPEGPVAPLDFDAAVAAILAGE